MKKLFLFLALLSPAGSFASNYSIDWHEVAGGGNTAPSTNSTYQFSGTASQHDAGGPMTNSRYSLTGGFWSLYSVQAPGTPDLSITYSGGEAIVSWAYPSTGWVLQQSPAFNGNWFDTSGVTNSGVSNYAVVPMPHGIFYFRLVYVLNSLGAPTVRIALTGQPPSAIISWNYPSPGWTLQTNNNLASGVWGNYVGTIVSNTITNTLPHGKLFYRLKGP